MFKWLTSRGKDKDKEIMDMMVRVEIENWFFKENLDRMVHGLEPIKWEDGNA